MDDLSRWDMVIRRYVQLLGAALIVLGLCGFIPELAQDGRLYGVFAVDPVHKFAHLLSGVVGVIAGSARNPNYALLHALTFGTVYLSVTILGIVGGVSALGIFVINRADDILHLLVALSALALFGVVEILGGSQAPA